MADETTLRELPPLRAAWARRGEQAIVEISGRNARRVLHGALNVTSGEWVAVMRERGRSADSEAFLQELGQRRPTDPKLVIWDNAPAHHTRAVQEAATVVGITCAFLPVRSPELNPCEDLWRQLKATVAANRTYAAIEDLAARALAWGQAPTPAPLRRTAGLDSLKFDWLPT